MSQHTCSHHKQEIQKEPMCNGEPDRSQEPLLNKNTSMAVRLDSTTEDISNSTHSSCSSGSQKQGETEAFDSLPEAHENKSPSSVEQSDLQNGEHVNENQATKKMPSSENSVLGKATTSDDITASHTNTENRKLSKEGSKNKVSDGASLKPKLRKSVSFTCLHVQEYGMTLGDHPAVTDDGGPPITLEWKPMSSFSIPIDEYEEQIENTQNSSHSDPSFSVDGSRPQIRRRSGIELRMPADVRLALLRDEHSREDMKKAATEARRIKSQRRATFAMADFEGTQQAFESVQRRFSKLFRKKRKDEPSNPSLSWLEEYKKNKKAQRKAASAERRRASAAL